MISYVDCPVFIYTEYGEQLGTNIVSQYEHAIKQIEMREPLPPALQNGGSCRLLILAEPHPREYMATVRRDRGRLIFALYKGKNKEHRKEMRHAVNVSAWVETFICDEVPHKLCESLQVEFVNISISGVRFKAVPNFLHNNDKVQFRMKLADKEKVLAAEVLNSAETGETAAYGCRFVKVGGVK